MPAPVYSTRDRPACLRAQAGRHAGTMSSFGRHLPCLLRTARFSCYPQLLQLWLQSSLPGKR